MMLPANRIENILQPYEIPKFSMEKRDIEEFITELQGFHEQFRDCITRPDWYQEAFYQVIYLLVTLPHKLSFRKLADFTFFKVFAETVDN